MAKLKDWQRKQKAQSKKLEVAGSILIWLSEKKKLEQKRQKVKRYKQQKLEWKQSQSNPPKEN